MHAWQTLYHLRRGDSHPSSARYKGALTVIQHSQELLHVVSCKEQKLLFPKPGPKCMSKPRLYEKQMKNGRVSFAGQPRPLAPSVQGQVHVLRTVPSSLPPVE